MKRRPPSDTYHNGKNDDDARVYHDGKPDDERKRERRRLAQQRYRRRFDDGRFTVTVEIDGAVVEMLIASRWLIDGESGDRKKVATAIAAMLAEAAAKR